MKPVSAGNAPPGPVVIFDADAIDLYDPPRTPPAVVDRESCAGADLVGQTRIAEVMSIVDAEATPELIARILDADPQQVLSALAWMTQAGVVDGGRIRDPELRRRLGHQMSIDTRKRLHGKAAVALHEAGAPATTVAGHLSAAGSFGYPWAATVLRNAADDLLAMDQIGRAVEYLEAAYRATTEAGERAEISAKLVSVEWRVNPSPATRNFARLNTALQTGRLSASTLPAVVRYLLWHGRVDEARAVLDLVERDRAMSRGVPTAELAFLRSWIAYSYPELPKPRTTTQPAATVPEASCVQVIAANLLTGVLTDCAGETTVAAAHRVLSRHRLDSSTLDALTTALECLIYSGQLEIAAAWCDTLLAEAAARCSPTWQSIFAGLRSEIALRQGDLAAAVRLAMAALNYVPAANLGTSIGRALSSCVLALTAAGRYDEARAQLDREVPLTLFDSRFALPYLRARGHYSLAMSKFDDALLDFQVCGSMMRRWRMDIPGLLPWRNDVAKAYLLAGDQRRARAFVRMHLDLLGDPGRHESGAVSLRLLAAMEADPRAELRLLRRAETIARSGHDRHELAVVLADLARAHESIGERDRARSVEQTALRLAGECGAGPVRDRLIGDRTAPSGTPSENTGAPPDVGSLSAAERRVAELAAGGSGNREIARRLGITTSTVEQHLTRVYRKLRVRRRTELRFLLRKPL